MGSPSKREAEGVGLGRMEGERGRGDGWEREMGVKLEAEGTQGMRTG